MVPPDPSQGQPSSKCVSSWRRLSSTGRVWCRQPSELDSSLLSVGVFPGGQMDFLSRLRVSSRGPTASPRVRRRRVLSVFSPQWCSKTRWDDGWFSSGCATDLVLVRTRRSRAMQVQWGSQVCTGHFERDVFRRTCLSWLPQSRRFFFRGVSPSVSWLVCGGGCAKVACATLGFVVGRTCQPCLRDCRIADLGEVDTAVRKPSSIVRG